MAEAFEILKQSDLEQKLEDVVHDWVMASVREKFGVEEFEDLSREQVDEIFSYANNSENYFAPYVDSVLISLCESYDEGGIIEPI